MVYQLSFVATYEGAGGMPAAEQLVRLREAIRDFERGGLTGLLLRHNTRLLYYMEGEQAAVDAQYDMIKRNPRVKGMAVLRQREIAERNFVRWGFALDDDPRPDVAGSLEDRVVKLVENAPPEIRQTFLAFAKLNTGRHAA